MDNVILAPHSAALTREALGNMGHSVADEILAVLSGKKPRHRIR